LAGNGIAPPDVASFFPGDIVAGVFVDDDLFDEGGFLEGFVDVGLERDDAAAAAPAIGRDDDGGFGVFDAIDDGLG